MYLYLVNKFQEEKMLMTSLRNNLTVLKKNIYNLVDSSHLINYNKITNIKGVL